MKTKQELYEEARALVNHIASLPAVFDNENTDVIFNQANEIRSAFWDLENKSNPLKLFYLDNTEGLTQEECDQLNHEFAQKWESGDYDHLKKIHPNEDDDFILRWAKKEFCDEVARR